jgi:hypothetical protein
MLESLKFAFCVFHRFFRIVCRADCDNPLQTFERLSVGVRKSIEKSHAVISHDTSRFHWQPSRNGGSGKMSANIAKLPELLRQSKDESLIR